MRALVLGSTGQVGKALLKILGENALGLSRAQVDFSNPSEVVSALDRISVEFHPEVVINAAAYTQVDLAEKEIDLAEKVNALTPTELAKWCRKKEIPFVHYSTDYVFSGVGKTSWKEEDPVGPLSVYGKTKLQGEKGIAEHGKDWLIFRTSWVYDAEGKNFLKTMLRLGADREELRVVQDQWGAPTYATHLAKATVEILEKLAKFQDFPRGIYHLCNAGETNWHGFASAIFDQARKKGISLRVQKVTPILTSEYPTPAKRPENSRLSTSKVEKTFGIAIPSWQSGLEQCIKEIR